MKDFEKITPTLSNLLKKLTKYEWADKCEWIFQESKRLFTTAPTPIVLAQGK